MVLRKPAVRAIFKRDMKRWFGNPAGYVFITLFVLLAAGALFFPDEFFQNNLANLDTLNQWFPWLLLFFIPAVTMSVWAGERGQGTDELLFTLPVTDTQVVVGKFSAAAGIYTMALAFCFPLLILLGILGNPDWGLVASNFLGYWLLGLTLIAAGMVGSQLSDNLTIAFIFGALLSGLVLTSEWLLERLSPNLLSAWIGHGPISLFREMAAGVVSISSLILFCGMVVVFLYLNLLLLSRRHWRSGQREGLHLSLRFVALLVGTFSLTVIAYQRAPRVDATIESIHSLSDETRRLVGGLQGDQPVYIRAYVSPEVPRDYVQARQTLLNLLREYDILGGDRVRVRVVETERFTDAAKEAETNYGIGFQTVMTSTAGRSSTEDVYLGVAVTCGTEEVVIPFLDKGLPVEYELTRSIRTVATTKRLRVGIVDTDAKLFGGFDFQAMSQDPQWEIVRELQLQYDVQKVDPSADYPTDLDALIAFAPSSLAQEPMDRLQAEIAKGIPTLLVDDPFPATSPDLAPTEKKGGPQNPFQQGQPPPEPKGDIQALLAKFGVRWQIDSVAWDTYNPHPEFPFEPELVFIGASSPSTQPFNPKEVVTAGLQEIITIFPGHVQSANLSGVEFVPLLQTGPVSGAIGMNDLFRTHFLFGKSINPNRRHVPDRNQYTLACRVRGKVSPEAAASVNLIFIADLDMIAGQFFEIRRKKLGDFSFDNITFVLNCIEDLAGKPEFIELRKRRPRHRTLETLEKQEEVFSEKWLEEKENAENAAVAELAKAEAALNEKVDRVRQQLQLDERSKEIQIESLRNVEQRRFDARKAEIEGQKQRAIDAALTEKTASEGRIRDNYRLSALIASPLPGLLIGLSVFFRRLRRERDSSVGSRRVAS
ncbi:MAG: Gldg family protein [Planctomycetota bacterium]